MTLIDLNETVLRKYPLKIDSTATPWRLWHSTSQARDIDPIPVWFDLADGCSVSFFNQNNLDVRNHGSCDYNEGVSIRLNLAHGHNYNYAYVDQYDVPELAQSCSDARFYRSDDDGETFLWREIECQSGLVAAKGAATAGEKAARIAEQEASEAVANNFRQLQDAPVFSAWATINAFIDAAQAVGTSINDESSERITAEDEAARIVVEQEAESSSSEEGNPFLARVIWEANQDNLSTQEAAAAEAERIRLEEEAVEAILMAEEAEDLVRALIEEQAAAAQAEIQRLQQVQEAAEAETQRLENQASSTEAEIARLQGWIALAEFEREIFQAEAETAQIARLRDILSNIGGDETVEGEAAAEPVVEAPAEPANPPAAERNFYEEQVRIAETKKLVLEQELANVQAERLRQEEENAAAAEAQRIRLEEQAAQAEANRQRIEQELADAEAERDRLEALIAAEEEEASLRWQEHTWQQQLLQRIAVQEEAAPVAAEEEAARVAAEEEAARIAAEEEEAIIAESECVNNPYYVDQYGDDCGWYVNNNDDCGLYDLSDLGLIAYDACCACGGGRTT